MSLLDTINHLITEVPVIGGALSLSLAGGVVAAFWKGPGKLKELYLKHFTVSFKLSNAGYNKGVAHYVAFMNWFQKGEFKKYSRSIGFEDGEYGSGGGVGPSKGTHYIWVDGVFYWVTVATPEGRGDSSRIIREVTIGTLGMNTNKLVNLFELFRDKDGDDSIPHIRKFNKEYWERNRPIAKRNWDTVILKKEIKDSLTDAIDEFLASREWYMTRGIPYKLVIVLYGEPGCGKSSIIKSLGHRYQMNIGILNLHQMSDVSLPKAIDSLPKNTLLAIEDFDTVSSVKSRTANHVSEPSEQETNLEIGRAHV